MFFQFLPFISLRSWGFVAVSIPIIWRLNATSWTVAGQGWKTKPRMSWFFSCMSGCGNVQLFQLNGARNRLSTSNSITMDSWIEEKGKH